VIKSVSQIKGVPMKCPKCGYHSFEFLDICKKCQADLSAHKSKYRINGFMPAPFSRKIETKHQVNLNDDEEAIAPSGEAGPSRAPLARQGLSTEIDIEPDLKKAVNGASLPEQFGGSSIPIFLDDDAKIDIEQPFSIDSERLPADMVPPKSTTEQDKNP
jgi:hypothetical protein